MLEVWLILEQVERLGWLLHAQTDSCVNSIALSLIRKKGGRHQAINFWFLHKWTFSNKILAWHRYSIVNRNHTGSQRQWPYWNMVQNAYQCYAGMLWKSNSSWKESRIYLVCARDPSLIVWLMVQYQNNQTNFMQLGQVMQSSVEAMIQHKWNRHWGPELLLKTNACTG